MRLSTARYESTDVSKLHTTTLNGFEGAKVDGVLVGGDDAIVNKKGEPIAHFQANLIAETFDVYEETTLYPKRIFHGKQARRTFKQKVAQSCSKRSSCLKGDALMVTLGNNTWASVQEKVKKHSDVMEASLKQKLLEAEAREKGESLKYGTEVGKKRRGSVLDGTDSESDVHTARKGLKGRKGQQQAKGTPHKASRAAKKAVGGTRLSSPSGRVARRGRSAADCRTPDSKIKDGIGEIVAIDSSPPAGTSRDKNDIDLHAMMQGKSMRRERNGVIFFVNNCKTAREAERQ